MEMCKPSGGIKKIYGKFGRNIPGTFGELNTRIDLYDIDNPNDLLQQRWYGADGRNLWDRDWKHNNSHNNHNFHHDHYWDWTKSPYRFEYKGPNNEDTNNSYC